MNPKKRHLLLTLFFFPSRNVFIVNTLDGKMNILNAIDGTLKWTKEVHRETLFSSTIPNFLFDEHGEQMQLIPSINGHIYRQKGKVFEEFTSIEMLIKRSLKLNENVMLVGGQESKMIGFDMDTGETVYECGLADCSQNADSLFHNVLWVKKVSQSVRALDLANGKQQWHFFVNNPQIIKLNHDGCLKGSQEYDIEASVVSENNTLCVTVLNLESQKSIVWKYQFESPIVSVWHHDSQKLTKVDFFEDNSHQSVIGFDNEQRLLLTHQNETPNSQDSLVVKENDFNYSLGHNRSLVFESYSSMYELFGLIKKDTCQRIASKPSELNELKLSIYKLLRGYWREISFICLASWAAFNFLWKKVKRYCFNYFHRKLVQEDRTEQTIIAERSRSKYSESDLFDKTSSSDQNDREYSSRFLKDFEQLELMGKGGFGLVFEAKHKIDENHYAVKRISIPANADKRDKFMREVRALSKLEHVGIVRYYSAWIEEPPSGWQEQLDRKLICDSLQTSIGSTYLTQTRTRDLTHDKNSLIRSPYNSNSLEIVFENSNENEADPTKNKAIKSQSSLPEFMSDNPTSMLSSIQSIENGTMSDNLSKLYVYIQMQLCKKETLKDWLGCNKERNKSETMKIFSQITDAMEYVHSNNLIHRDLKVCRDYDSCALFIVWMVCPVAVKHILFHEQHDQNW